jgi:hypothetical protein
VHSSVVSAAAKAGIRYVMPNAYGLDFFRKPALTAAVPAGQAVVARAAESANAGMVWIAMTTGPWYEYSLRSGEALYGFDFAKRSVVLYDDGNTAVDTTTWAQCGRTIASLLSLPLFPEDEEDAAKTVTLSRFFGRTIAVSSFRVSQRDMLASVQRVTGTTDADWKIVTQNAEERYAEGVKEMEQGNMLGFFKSMYARVFYPDGVGLLETDNEALGLPVEDLDEATKVVLDMVKEA